MLNSIQVVSLAGSASLDPFCFLLIANGYRILLDCGCDTSFDETSLQYLKETVSRGLHCVLLSQPDLPQLGALPILTSRFGYTGPIYATNPIVQLGNLMVRTAALARAEAGQPLPFGPKDVSEAFHKITILRYQQPKLLELPGPSPPSIEVTAYNSGCNLGGCVWRVSVNGEDIVYAPRFNPTAERHLEGATALFQGASQLDWGQGKGGPGAPGQGQAPGARGATGSSIFTRPAVMVVSAPVPGRYMDPRPSLVAAVIETLRADGNTLIPVASVGRAFEVALTLGDHWRRSKSPYGLALLAPYGERLFALAKSHLEFAADAFRDSFQAALATKAKKASQAGGAANPFLPPDLVILENLDQIDSLPRGPKAVIVLAPGGLDEGPARDLLALWAEGESNAVVFTGPQPPGSLGRQLQESQPPVVVRLDGLERVALQGEELVQHHIGGPGVGEEAAGGGLGVAPPGASLEGEDRAAEGAEGAGPSTPFVLSSAKASVWRRRALGGGFDEDDGYGDDWRSTVLIDGFTAPESAAPLFPYRAARYEVEIDEYGEVLGPDDVKSYFQEDSYDFGEGAAGAVPRAPGDVDGPGGGPDGGGAQGDGSSITTDPLAALLNPEQPFRVVRTERTVWCALRTYTVELPGRAHEMEFLFSLEAVAPRRVVLARSEWGNTLETARGKLEADVSARRIRTQVDSIRSPAVPLDVTPGVTPFVVRLGQDILSRGRLLPRGDCSLGVIKGHVTSTPLADGGADDGGAAEAGRGPRLAPGRPPRSADPAVAWDGSQLDELFIGDSAPRTIQAALKDVGLTAEFRGAGILVCPSAGIFIRFSQTEASLTPDICIDGPLSADFYKAKGVIDALFRVALK